MKNEKSEKEKDNKKDEGDAFIYAVILFGALILGTLAIILKGLGVF